VHHLVTTNGHILDSQERLRQTQWKRQLERKAKARRSSFVRTTRAWRPIVRRSISRHGTLRVFQFGGIYSTETSRFTNTLEIGSDCRNFDVTNQIKAKTFRKPVSNRYNQYMEWVLEFSATGHTCFSRAWQTCLAPPISLPRFVAR
jgi:hypothetical protein